DPRVESCVLPPRELRIEACAELEERGDAAPGDDASLGRGDDPADDLEQGGLAASVLANYAEELPLPDLQVQLLKRREPVRLDDRGGQQAQQALARGADKVVGFRYALGNNGCGVCDQRM